MPLTTYTIQLFGNRLWRNVAGTWPSTVYAGLFKVAPTVAGGGTEFTTSDFTQYARIACSFGAPSGRVFTNDTAITFTSSATMGSPATATHIGLFTALTGGSLLAYGALTASLLIGAGTPVIFPIGQLTIDELGTA